MRALQTIALMLFCAVTHAQDPVLTVGSKAPPFIMELEENTIQSIQLPRDKKIALVHFYGPAEPASRRENHLLKKLLDAYATASYRNANGFEIVAVATSCERSDWRNFVLYDTLGAFTNGYAPKGLSDAACELYHVTQLPYDVLVNENGSIVAINPKLAAIESFLDSEKNNVPVRKPLSGVIACRSSFQDVFAFTTLHFTNIYGDTIVIAKTDGNGRFGIPEIPLNHPLVLLMNFGGNFSTSDPAALYSNEGKCVATATSTFESVSIVLTPLMMSKLTQRDANVHTALPRDFLITKELDFDEHNQLTEADKRQLSGLLQTLKQNVNYHLDVMTHAPARSDTAIAFTQSSQEADAIVGFLESNGLAPSRITAHPLGNTRPRFPCAEGEECDEQTQRQNHRVEFRVWETDNLTR